ncbi:MAG: hypothetical protein IJS28_12595 [Synergistaceae bacterium]|nr:hypothetical protein [Synergistaceae bacterium]
MSIDKLLRWASFCAGIITAIFAGYMFYKNDTAKGAACLAVCVGFLSFATRFQAVSIPSAGSSNDDSDLHALAVLVADLAAMSLQNIGRTVPPGTKEIADVEEKLNAFLDAMPMSAEEREEIAEKFESLKDRTRRNQGGRAIMRSSRL